MTTLRPRLDSLPLHVIENISSHLDEVSVWRMRAVSRHQRQGAERVLQDWLVQRTVVVEPSFTKDLFGSLDSNLATTDILRLSKLRDTAQAFQTHHVAFPPSRNQLRRLELEIREDEPMALQLLSELGPQLQELQLNIWDRNWVISMTESLDSDNHESYGPFLADLERDASLPLDGPPLLLPLLDRLCIVATSRVIDYFFLLARDLSNLKHLTLCNRYTDVTYDFHDMAYLPVIRQLHSLTLSGDDSFIFDLWCEIISGTPSALQYLTIHITPPSTSRDHGYTYIPRLEEWFTGPHRSLKGLALLGPISNDMLEQEATRRSSLPVDATFESTGKLETLVMEEGSSYQLRRLPNLYPLLDNDMQLLPLFDALKTIIWVDRRTDHEGISLLDLPVDSNPAYSYSDDKLRNLFANYGKLTELLWIAEYPKDPSFWVVPPQHIKRRFTRPLDM